MCVRLMGVFTGLSGRATSTDMYELIPGRGRSDAGMKGVSMQQLGLIILPATFAPTLANGRSDAGLKDVDLQQQCLVILPTTFAPTLANGHSAALLLVVSFRPAIQVISADSVALTNNITLYSYTFFTHLLTSRIVL